MTPRTWPWGAMGVSVVVAAGFALIVRLPLPFDGFAAVVAAVLAGGLTFSLALMAPARWIWTDTERLRHAFAVRHGMSDGRSGNVLAAITTAHARAATMRKAAGDFAAPLADRTRELADRMDAVARQLFYDPDALKVHRQSLVRSELIEEAVTTHATLRRRGETDANAAQVAESREKVEAALDALDEAFDSNESRLASQLLQQVDVSSATAELLLRR